MLKRRVVAFLILAATSIAGAAQDLPRTNSEVVLTGSNFVALRVRDVGASSSWYQSVFGLNEVNRIEAEDGQYSIRILSGRGLTVELIEQRGVEQPADRHLGLFKVGLFVEDIDALHLRFDQLGVDQDAGIFVDEALNARSFVFRDSEGNRLQAFQRCDDSC